MRTPDAWAAASLGSLIQFVTSGSRGWAAYYADDGAPFIRMGDLSRSSLHVDLGGAQRVRPPANAEGRRTQVAPGDLLISITAELGMVGVVPEGAPEAYINQHVALVRPSREFAPRYLAWYLAAECGGRQQFKGLRRGATKQGLGLDDIRGVVVPVAPRAEQRRIVAELEKQFTRLDAAVATLEGVRAKLKRARASVLKAAVEGRLVPTEAELARQQGRPYEPAPALLARLLEERRRRWPPGKKYKPPVEPDVDSLPEAPDGWSWAVIDQLAAPESRAITDGPFGSNLKSSHYTEAGPRVLRLENVGDGAFRDERTHVDPDHFARLAKHSAAAGDLLIASLGTALPKACVVPPSVGPAIVKADVIRFRPHPDLEARFINVALNSPPVRHRTSEEVHGVGRPRLGLDVIRAIAIPLPPLAEQQRIVAEVERRLSVLDALERTVEQNLARCARLRQSILKRAFEGRLVPQDPTDEPASALLARLRSTKEPTSTPASVHVKKPGRRPRAKA